MTRTPEAHRKEVEAWRATAPANDNEILRRPRTSASPRHAALAGQLEPLRDWFDLEARAQPDGAAIEAANDNQPDPELPVMDPERVLDIRPTIAEVVRATEAEGGPASIDRDAEGRIIRQAGFWFNEDGALREYWTPRGKRPAREQLRGEKGEAPPPRSVAHLNRILGPGAAHLPAAGGNPASLFMSGKVASRVGAGAQQGIVDREAREVDRMWAAIRAAHVRARMAADTVRTVNALGSAANMADLGRAHGYTGKTAERRGKALLFAANDNIRQILAEVA